MVDAPPLPLFGDEAILGRWQGHYLPRDPLRPGPRAPGGWMAALRSRLLTGREDAVPGELVLTDWRLVFCAVPGQGHDLKGHFSLFLARLSLLRWKPSGWFEFAHVGSKNPMLWTHEFLVASPRSFEPRIRIWRLLGSLERQRVFETSVAESWWQAGLGLLRPESRASLPTLAEGYRTSGPPLFEELSARLHGIEGEGLTQLRWLLQPDEPEPPRPPALPSPPVPFTIKTDEGAISGRPLRVRGRRRRSAMRRGVAWR